MTGCELRINGRTIVSSESDPLEVEYALFSPGDLKLGAAAIGQVRELGYETTVEAALKSLEALGATAGLAERVTMILRGTLGEHYAKGPAVFRHVGGLLPHQILQSERYLNRTYVGTYLDLEGLVQGAGIANLGNALQALHLAALLVEVDPAAQVSLNTESLSLAKPTAYRSYQRVRFTDLRSIPDRLLALQKTAMQPRPIERERGLSRSELAARVREEARHLSSEDAKQRLKAFEGEILTRTPRATGPLSDPDLWLLEAAMDEGRTEGVEEQLELLEAEAGKTPATAYLRARCTLLRGEESAKSVAERVTSLALSMSSFIELEVLAAEAWLRASEWKRAQPFARDVLSNPAADEVLRARAARVVQLAQDATAGHAVSASMFAKPAVTTFPDTTPSVRPHSVQVPSSVEIPGPAPVPGVPAFERGWSEPPAPSIAEPPPTTRRASHPAIAPEQSQPPPSGGGREEPPVTVRGGYASIPPVSTPLSVRPPEPFLPSARPEPPPQHPSRPLEVTEARASAPPISLEPPARPSSIPPSAYGVSASTLMKAASLPPFGTLDNVPRVSNRAQSMSIELAEHLDYPGIYEVDILRIPQNHEDARRVFTKLTRDLAIDYRETLGITLRLDLVSLEAIQNYLAETLPSGTVRTSGEAREIRRHGAFLSEMLARRLQAQWCDLSGDELGHWKMSVAPGTLVYPFGRVVRYVRMQRRERDLVSYFLELENGLLRSLVP